MKANKEKISEKLDCPQAWKHINHILADYMLYPAIPILFGDKGKYPSLAGNRYYHKIFQQAKAEEKKRAKGTASVRKDKLNRLWRPLFSRQLVRFFYLRLLGSQKDMAAYRERMKAYHNLFLDLIGDGETGGNFPKITCDYLDMIRDYLLRNCPGGSEEDRSIPLDELLRKVRDRYSASTNTQRQGYIKFEKETYTQGIIGLLDDVAHGGQKHSLCRYFLIVSEYISALFIYIYMVEFLIYCQNMDNPLAGKQPNLIQYLQDYKFAGEDV